MKNKKFEISVIVFVSIISLILFGLYLVIKTYKENNSYTLFTKPYNILKCTKYYCENVEDKNNYNNKKYETFIDGEYVGNNNILYNPNNNKYYVFNDSNENLFNNDNNSPERKYFLLGVSGKVEVESVHFTPELMTKENFESLSELTKMQIQYSDLPYYKYTLDFDNDGMLETIYAYNFTNDNKYYSLLAYEKDSKIKIIEFNEYENINNVAMYSLQDVIDVYKDGKLEILITKTNLKELCTLLYRVKNNKLVTNTKCNK